MSEQRPYYVRGEARRAAKFLASFNEIFGGDEAKAMECVLHVIRGAMDTEPHGVGFRDTGGVAAIRFRDNARIGIYLSVYAHEGVYKAAIDGDWTELDASTHEPRPERPASP